MSFALCLTLMFLTVGCFYLSPLFCSFFFSFGSVNVPTGENTQLALLTLKYIQPYTVNTSSPQLDRSAVNSGHSDDRLHALADTNNALNIGDTVMHSRVFVIVEY